VAFANVELVRSIFEAWERGDFSSVEWAHPDIEFVIADGPSVGSWTGLAGMAEGFREAILSPVEQYRTEAEEYREIDDARVLVLNHAAGRFKTSGIELEEMPTKGATVFRVREGRVTKLVLYADRERALADLGLASQTDSPRS
jgi:ketosteroid isomerase-like protein